jgi:hypothetical protein
VVVRTSGGNESVAGGVKATSPRTFTGSGSNSELQRRISESISVE